MHLCIIIYKYYIVNAIKSAMMYPYIHTKTLEYIYIYIYIFVSGKSNQAIVIQFGQPFLIAVLSFRRHRRSPLLPSSSSPSSSSSSTSFFYLDSLTLLFCHCQWLFLRSPHIYRLSLTLPLSLRGQRLIKQLIRRKKERGVM